MRQKLRRWLALPPADRRLFIEAWLELLWAGVGLRWRWLARRAPRPGRRGGPSVPPTETVARLRRWVGIAAVNHPGRAACLERSLALRAMLARRGLDAELRIGVRRRGGDLDAHAWLESGGRPLAGEQPAARGYRALASAAGER